MTVEDDYYRYKRSNDLLQLFQQDAADQPSPQKAVSPEEERWHRLLIDVIYYFGLAISEERPEKGKQIDIYIDRLIQTFRELERMPDHDRTIMVRGKELFFSGQRAVLRNDYNLYFGPIRLDLRSVTRSEDPFDDAASQLPTRLAIAYERLARYRIQTLSIEIPRQSPADIQRLRLSLRILSAFHQALQSKVPIHYFDGRTDHPIVIVTDMNEQPNPNLTMLAALNHLEPDLLRGFIRNVDGWIRRTISDPTGGAYTSIYSTLFGIRKLIKNLRMPSFEINNVNWLMLDRLHNILSSEKAEVLRLVEEKSESRPDEGAQIMESIYGDDYDRIEAHALAHRLLLVSGLLETIEDDWTLQDTCREIRENIRKRLERVPDDVLEAVALSGNEIWVRMPADAEKDDEESFLPVLGTASETLSEMLRHAKAHSATRRKIKSLINGSVTFDTTDYENIAEEFGVDRDGAERLVGLLAGCFDQKGHFRRSVFSQQLEDFAVFEKIIFDFLWHYLGEIMKREERLAFLNALQHLIARLHQPRKTALKLIADFFFKPNAVRFSDRNALMLASLLTRTYNQELNIDTNLTPEDVLMVSEGINSGVSEALRQWIETGQKHVFQKIQTIDRQLSNALSRDKGPSTDHSPAAEMPLKFLLALKRETFICLGLIGGETAFSIIRNAAIELGDPEAALHHLKNSGNVRLQLILLLQTAVRALARAGEPEDVPLLKSIRKRETAFLAFRETDERYVERVRRAMQWIDQIVAEIEAMSNSTFT